MKMKKYCTKLTIFVAVYQLKRLAEVLIIRGLRFALDPHYAGLRLALDPHYAARGSRFAVDPHCALTQRLQGLH